MQLIAPDLKRTELNLIRQEAWFWHHGKHQKIRQLRYEKRRQLHQEEKEKGNVRRRNWIQTRLDLFQELLSRQRD